MAHRLKTEIFPHGRFGHSDSQILENVFHCMKTGMELSKQKHRRIDCALVRIASLTVRKW